MPSNEKIAIAAHLHVLLRRKTGRVTDTEWMATNKEYATEIARFAREKAAEDGHVDLNVWADKLEEIMSSPDPKERVPLVRMVSDAVKHGAPHPAPGGDPRHVNTHDEVYPESGFIESTLGSTFGEDGRRIEKRDPASPRYVKGLR